MSIDDLTRLLGSTFRSQYPSRSVAIANWEGDSFNAEQMACFLRLMGVEGDDLVAGWFAGKNLIDDYTDHLQSRPLGRVTLKPGSDWDWVMWRASSSALLEAIAKTDEGPNVLLPVSAEWVLESPLTLLRSYLTVLPIGAAPAIAQLS